ncbi:MAG TPA: formylglycine-generating enzyme family protein [Polyangiaceae bacterium]
MGKCRRLSGLGASCSGGVCGQPASCQVSAVGTTTCGSSSESCCASLEVSGGAYHRTHTNSGSGPTGEADPATVSGFRLDKYDVTVGRFRQFVSAWNGGWTPPAGSGKHAHLNAGQGLANSASAGTYETGWITADNGNIAPTSANLSDATCDPTSSHSYATWTTSAGSNEAVPINCENWFEAYAFCIWDGGFLPSEAEWEYAAGGGSQEREYPWGSTDPGTANQYAIYDCYYPNGSGTCTGVQNIAPVGTATLGVGLWGQLDLGGNVWQWNLDWDAAYVDPCTDCGYLSAVSYREVQGGLFSGTTAGLMPPNRYDAGPTSRVNNIGFRCARVP